MAEKGMGLRGAAALPRPRLMSLCRALGGGIGGALGVGTLHGPWAWAKGSSSFHCTELGL